MDESKINTINQLFEALLARVQHDISHQPPDLLPPIAQVVMNLYGMKEGLQNAGERSAVEISLIKNINKQINNGFNQPPPRG